MIFTLTMELHPLCYVKSFFYARIYWREKSKTVSPLISLMEDQVSKLNGLMNAVTDKKEFATFLGSGQANDQAETRALAGKYSLIYCTPEKLTANNGWFLDALGKLHSGGLQNGKELCLIAIDESHCVR